MIEFKEHWVERCGGVEPFCLYMRKYRLNFLLDPTSWKEGDACTLGASHVYTMNKFFNFNPYDDVTFYMFLTKFLGYVFLLAVGVRVSVDVNRDTQNRQKALLIADRYSGEIERLRTNRTYNIQRAHFWIYAGG